MNRREHNQISKYLLFIILTTLLLIVSLPAKAAVITWDGGGADNNWSTCENWSGDTCPGVADVATFDATSTKDASIDSSFSGSLSGIDINTGYTGTITQARSLTMGTGGFNQNAGTFTGSSDEINLNGDFTLSTGTFTATSGTFYVSGDLNVTGGTFNHNSGTVFFDSNSDRNLDVPTDFTFHNVTINTLTGNFEVTIVTATDIIINNTFAPVNGGIKAGNIKLRGNLITNSLWDTNTSSLTIDGTGTQSLNFANAVWDGDVIIDKSSGTAQLISTQANLDNLTIANGTLNLNGNNLTVTDTFQQTGGTFISGSSTLDFETLDLDAGTFNASSGTTTVANNMSVTGSVTFNHNNGLFDFDITADRNLDVPTDFTFYNLEIGAIANSYEVSIVTATSVIVENDFTGTNGGMRDQTLKVRGHVYISNSWDINTTTLTVDGSGNQDLQLSNGFWDGIVTIDKSGGTASLINTTANLDGLIVANGTLDLNSQNLTVTGTLQQTGGIFTSGASTLDLTDLDLDGGTFNASSNQINISGHMEVEAGFTFNTNFGTIYFDVSTDRNLDVPNDFEFYNLTLNAISPSFEVNIVTATSIIVNNTFTAINGGIYSGAIKARGNVDIQTSWDTNTSTLTIDGTSDQDISFGVGTWDGIVTINKSSGTANMVTTTANLDGLIIQNGTLDTNSLSLTVTGTFQQTGGVFVSDGSTLDFATVDLDDGTFNATTATMSVSGSFSAASGVTFTPNSGNVTFDSSSNSSLDVFNNFTFSALTINGNANTRNLTVSTASTIITTGLLTLTNGNLDNVNIEARGDVSLNTNFDGGTANLYFTGSATQSFTANGSSSFEGNVFVNKTGGLVNQTGNFTLNDASQNFTIEEGTYDLNGNNLIVNGSGGVLTVQDGGNLQLQGGETITTNGGVNPTLQTGSTITYDGTAGPYSVKDYDYHHLTLNGSGAVFNLSNNEPIAGNLTITAGTLDLIGYHISVAGTVSNDDQFRLVGSESVSLTMDTDSGTVTYTGTGTYNQIPIAQYFNLAFNGTGGSWTANQNLDVNGNLTINQGTINGGGYQIAVAGNWTNSASFVHGNSTVILDGGNQTLAGSNTFYHLQKTTASAVTLTFPEGTTTTVAGNLTLYGTSGNNLSLRSSVDGNAFTLNPQGARIIQYLDVKDSTNSNASNIDCFLGCTDSTGNTKWDFTLSTAGSVSQTWEFTETSSDYTFNSSYVELNVGSNSLARLKDLGSGQYKAPQMVDGQIYSKRKRIAITENSGSTLTNFQVRLTVAYDPDMQADFDDVRFVNYDFSQVLDYWIETKTDSTTATIWVEVPSLPASTSTDIYMLYGNADVSTTSNGNNTFIFFDDFENFSGWSDTGSGSVEQSSEQVYSGSYSLKKIRP